MASICLGLNVLMYLSDGNNNKTVAGLVVSPGHQAYDIDSKVSFFMIWSMKY